MAHTHDAHQLTVDGLYFGISGCVSCAVSKGITEKIKGNQWLKLGIEKGQRAISNKNRIGIVEQKGRFDNAAVEGGRAS